MTLRLHYLLAIQRADEAGFVGFRDALVALYRQQFPES